MNKKHCDNQYCGSPPTPVPKYREGTTFYPRLYSPVAKGRWNIRSYYINLLINRHLNVV